MALTVPSDSYDHLSHGTRSACSVATAESARGHALSDVIEDDGHSPPQLQHPRHSVETDLSGASFSRENRPYFSTLHRHSFHAASSTAAYSEKYHDLLQNPLFQHVRREAIRDMFAYAEAHGLLDSDEDIIPESAFKKSDMRNYASFIWFCFRDSFSNNPYKLHWAIYLGMGLSLIWCVSLKWYIVASLLRKWWQAYTSGNGEMGNISKQAMDTLASVFPVVVTFVLFLFPPLIANT